MKTCKVCRESFPATTDYFYKDRNSLRTVCKKCWKLKCDKYNRDNKDKVTLNKKEYREKHKVETVAYMKDYYIQNKDKKKDYDKERYNRLSDEYKEKSRNWYYENKEVALQHQSEYRIENREMILFKQREFYWPKYYSENKEKILAYARSYRVNNKETRSITVKKYSLKNKEKIKEKQRRYRIENKEKINNWTQQRIAKRKGLISTFTQEEWQECLIFFNYLDAYTGKPMSKPTKDHVIPVTKGGGYVKSNIVPCEMEINISKHNYDMEEWFRKQPFFSEQRLKKIHEWIHVDEKSNTQQLALF